MKKKGPRYKLSCPRCGSVKITAWTFHARCDNCRHVGHKNNFRGLSGHQQDDREHDYGRVLPIKGADEQ